MQLNHPLDSWMIPAHVERQRKYTISDFRDLNNAAPTVCFGFESMPGHQKEPDRGSYAAGADGGGTYGGCGIYAAKVGNLWDALLGEGRCWWLFASSDFHSTGADFWPGEYQKTYVKVADPDDPWAIVDGMRSGNVFVVEGDLIDALDFSVKYKDDEATMGETLVVERDEHDKSKGRRGKNDEDGTQVTITIRFRSPHMNNNGDHVLCGPHRPDRWRHHRPNPTRRSRSYTNATNSTARVLARFKADDWKTKKNGWKEIVFHTRLQKNTYLRLRGTNNPLNSTQIDPVTGDPALDVPGTNTAAAAWSRPLVLLKSNLREGPLNFRDAAAMTGHLRGWPVSFQPDAKNQLKNDLFVHVRREVVTEHGTVTYTQIARRLRSTRTVAVPGVTIGTDSPNQRVWRGVYSMASASPLCAPTSGTGISCTSPAVASSGTGGTSVPAGTDALVHSELHLAQRSSITHS